MAAGNFIQDPLNAAVEQGGFSREKGGNLRDHNGCVQGAGTASTTHYDGDYGTTGASTPPPMGMTRAVDTGDGGAPVGPSGGGAASSGVAPVSLATMGSSPPAMGGILKSLRRGRGGIKR